MFICNHCPFVKHLKKDIVKLTNFYMKVCRHYQLTRMLLFQFCEYMNTELTICALLLRAAERTGSCCDIFKLCDDSPTGLLHIVISILELHECFLWFDYDAFPFHRMGLSLWQKKLKHSIIPFLIYMMRFAILLKGTRLFLPKLFSEICPCLLLHMS